MSIFRQLLFLLGGWFLCALVYAGTPVLGFEIGVTSADQMRKVLAKQTKFEEKGINKYSGGIMLATGGDSYEIEGLNSVLYIFDDSEKLVGVMMEMDKDRFDAIFKFLASKYKVAYQKRPYVGDQFARFKPSDTTIELDAPHLSFTMGVRYIRNDLMQRCCRSLKIDHQKAVVLIQN